jgi:PAS domain S-box-containing protein
MVKERVIGVVQVGTVRPHLFTNEDAQLLHLVADRFAVAVDRAQLYAAAHEAEQRKGAILEAALDCIIIMDHHGVITDFNPAAQRTFGYSQDEAVGQPLANLIIPPHLRQAHSQGLSTYLETGEGPVINQRVEITGMRADGTEFPVELSVIPLNVHGQPFFTGYLRDITERKQAEAERESLLAQAQEARAEAEAANRAKDEFLATLSHELRTPLTPMMGWTQLLLSKKLDETDAEEALQSIQNSAKTQLKLVEDLLDVSRVITGKLVLETCPVDLEPIILQAVNTVRSAAEIKHIQIQTVFQLGAGNISGDKDRLHQIVTNLLSNAIKFTPRGGHVEVRLERVDTYAQMQVMDTGSGIRPDFLPFVFDRLRQGDSSDTRQHGGLGLGLSIVHHLVELHGGTIEAQSAGTGQGSTFTIRLPLQRMRSEVPSREAANGV